MYVTWLFVISVALSFFSYLIAKYLNIIEKILGYRKPYFYIIINGFFYATSVFIIALAFLSINPKVSFLTLLLNFILDITLSSGSLILLKPEIKYKVNNKYFVALFISFIFWIFYLVFYQFSKIISIISLISLTIILIFISRGEMNYGNIKVNRDFLKISIVFGISTGMYLVISQLLDMIKGEMILVINEWAELIAYMISIVFFVLPDIVLAYFFYFILKKKENLQATYIGEGIFTYMLYLPIISLIGNIVFTPQEMYFLYYITYLTYFSLLLQYVFYAYYRDIPTIVGIYLILLGLSIGYVAYSMKYL